MAHTNIEMQFSETNRPENNKTRKRLTNIYVIINIQYDCEYWTIILKLRKLCGKGEQELLIKKRHMEIDGK